MTSPRGMLSCLKRLVKCGPYPSREFDISSEYAIAVAALWARVARGIRTLAGKGDVGVSQCGYSVWELDLKEGIDFTIYQQRGWCNRALSLAFEAASTVKNGCSLKKVAYAQKHFFSPLVRCS
jgi:hypothetical protein